MGTHPAIQTVTERIRQDVIGGAVDTAKEVMAALGEVAQTSPAATTQELFAELDLAATEVLRVCPSFAPPINVLHMLMGTVEEDLAAGAPVELTKQHLVQTQAEILGSIETALSKIADIGAELIRDGFTVFMFSMSSSVWRVLRRAKEQGKRFRVLVTEARPANEGLWTVDEMVEIDVPVEVSVDACLAEMIARSDIVLAGVDAVAADGSVFNKAGSYLCALAAREFGVPFYFVTDTLKFDMATLQGLPFRSDPVQYHEVLGDRSYAGEVKVVGKLFDITPAHLITALITELGPIHPSACVQVMWKMKASRRISEQLPDWAYGRL